MCVHEALLLMVASLTLVLATTGRIRASVIYRLVGDDKWIISTRANTELKKLNKQIGYLILCVTWKLS